MAHKIINCPHCGKIKSEDALVRKSRPAVKCPECGSQRNCKAGFRYTKSSKAQRYLCRDCGYRFSHEAGDGN